MTRQIACSIVDHAHAQVVLLCGVIRHCAGEERGSHRVFIEDDALLEPLCQCPGQGTFSGGWQAGEEDPCRRLDGNVMRHGAMVRPHQCSCCYN